jgi:acyl-CoA thioesterase FadM
MYPYIKLARVLWQARRSPKLELRDRTELQFRVGLTDADLFGELNNARYLVYTELARWDYSLRVGFIALMRRNKWGLAVGGASLRYRRRVPLFARFTVSSELVGHDGRWFYFLHEFHCNERICCSALLKAGATSKQGLVPAAEVMENFGVEMNPGIPAWVAAWIEADSLRPWPGNG